MNMEFIFILVFVLLAVYSSYKLKANIVYSFPLFYIFSFLYTYLGANYFKYAYIVPFHDQIGYEIDFKVVGFAYLLCILGFIFGIKFGEYKYSFGQTYQIVPQNNSIKINLRINEYVIYTLSLLTIIIGFFAYDFSQLISRSSYIIDRNNQLVIIHKFFLIATSFLVVFIKNRMFRIIIFLLILVVPFSLNSRILSLCIFIFYLGVYVKNGFNLKLKHTLLLIILLISSFLITLEFRSQALQGLIPNIDSLFNFNLDREIFWSSINYVTSYSVFATQYAIDNNYSDIKSFFISINPLPSSFLDIDYVIDNSKINAFSPVPALAMSYNSSPLITIIYYFFSGLIFSHILRNLKTSKLYFLALCIFFLFMFTSSQYMIRECTRLIYYLIIVYVVRFLYIKVKW